MDFDQTYRISRIHSTYHLYQKWIKSDQWVLRYGSRQTKSMDGRTEWTYDANTISLWLRQGINRQRSGIETIMYHTWPSTQHGKVTKTQEKHQIQESQEVRPFPAGDHKATMNRQESMTNIPYGKKCTAANNFREQLANALRILCEYSGNTLRLLGNHNLIWLTSIRGMFARCSLFTCKLGLPRTLPRIFREHAFKSVD